MRSLQKDILKYVLIDNKASDRAIQCIIDLGMITTHKMVADYLLGLDVIPDLVAESIMMSHVSIAITPQSIIKWNLAEVCRFGVAFDARTPAPNELTWPADPTALINACLRHNANNLPFVTDHYNITIKTLTPIILEYPKTADTDVEYAYEPTEQLEWLRSIALCVSRSKIVAPVRVKLMYCEKAVSADCLELLQFIMTTTPAAADVNRFAELMTVCCVHSSVNTFMWLAGKYLDVQPISFRSVARTIMYFGTERIFAAFLEKYGPLLAQETRLVATEFSHRLDMPWKWHAYTYLYDPGTIIRHIVRYNDSVNAFAWYCERYPCPILDDAIGHIYKHMWDNGSMFKSQWSISEYRYEMGSVRMRALWDHMGLKP